jgi:hypothetical protein
MLDPTRLGMSFAAFSLSPDSLPLPVGSNRLPLTRDALTHFFLVFSGLGRYLIARALLVSGTWLLFDAISSLLFFLRVMLFFAVIVAV